MPLLRGKEVQQNVQRRSALFDAAWQPQEQIIDVSTQIHLFTAQGLKHKITRTLATMLQWAQLKQLLILSVMKPPTSQYNIKTLAIGSIDVAQICRICDPIWVDHSWLKQFYLCQPCLFGIDEIEAAAQSGCHQSRPISSVKPQVGLEAYQ